MQNDLIYTVSRLMREQAASYKRLVLLIGQLSASLTVGELASVESLTKSAEGELFPMRARLVQIMGNLTAFSDGRSSSPDDKITPETRSDFESASSELLFAARDFQKQQRIAAALAGNGAVFASSCMELCGVSPTTYRAPYSRRGEARRWA